MKSQQLITIQVAAVIYISTQKRLNNKIQKQYTNVQGIGDFLSAG